MPEFSWEPLDFLDVLGVAPEEGEYGISYRYVVVRTDLRLEISIWPLESDVTVEIFCAAQAQPIARFNMLSCPGARVVRDKEGVRIEFAGANLFTGRYDHTAAAPYGLRLWLDPFIQVDPYAYPT
jgi:hypothetical protein